MTESLRSLLHTLADRIADDVRSEPVSASRTGDARSDDAHIADAILAALTAIAQGDLSVRHALPLEGRPEGARIGEIVTRIRELHAAAQAAVGAGTSRLDEVRAAAERASDTASRQRLVLERSFEQLKQVAQRVDDLSAAATEIGEASERASLLALNTGIEGLRVGGEVARTLGSLGEELRKLSQRAAAGARELSDALKSVTEQAKAVASGLEDARNSAKLSGEEAARAAAAAESARRADTALAAAVSRFHVMDTHTEALVVQIETAVERLEGDVARAREQLGMLEPAARSAVEAALSRVANLSNDKAGTPR